MMQDRYNPTGFDCDSPEEVNEDVLVAPEGTKRGFALAAMVDGKRMFLNFSPTLPFLTEFPYSVSDVPFEQSTLQALGKPPFGRGLKSVEQLEVEFSEKDAEAFYKRGGVPQYRVVS